MQPLPLRLLSKLKAAAAQLNLDPAANGWGIPAYIGSTLDCVRGYREGAAMLPWSEDWLFQTPVASQQIMTLMLDAMRSGVQWAPDHHHLEGGARRATTSVDNDPSGDGDYERVPTPKRHVDMMMYIMKHWP